MKQLQDFAYLLWLGEGEKIDLTVIRYNRDKKRSEFSPEEKMKMFELNYVQKVTMAELSKIFKAHPSVISKYIREIKEQKGIPIRSRKNKENI